MEIFRTINPARQMARTWKARGQSVGVVPTMGFLHAGHESLIRRAMAENGQVLVTVFVNPTQFAPNEDLAAYPRDLGRDLAICESLGVGAVFCPEPGEMYPSGFATQVSLPSMSQVLCGRSRPHHFQGVCTVCAKLFAITEPDRAYFGLKDAQQYFILRRMVRDLDLDLELVPCPIVREPDGLALSSRNSYLEPAERRAAPVLSRALRLAGELAAKGERRARELIGAIEVTVAGEPLARLDYAQVVDTETLSEADQIESEVLVAAAMWLGRTRLIDNLIFDPGAR